MPYPNEHACRIRDPGDFEKDSFRTQELGTHGVKAIEGHLKGETTMTVQAYRFPKDKFTAAEAKKWLKDNGIKKYISFEAAKEMSKGALESESKIIKRENGKIYVAGVLQRTGVYNGGLKPWDEWKDSIPLMVGTSIIRGEHPEDPISGDFVPIDNEADIIGRIAEALADEKNQLARGIYELDEDKLNPEEIKALEEGNSIGTSPGYWCDKKNLPAPKLWEDGTPYTFIEKKSFLYDHFATPLRPACHDCGMLINSKIGEDSIGKIRSPEEIKEAVAQIKPEGEPAFLVNQAIDEVALQNMILDIMECKDSFEQGRNAISLLVQLLRTILAVPPEQGLAAMSLKHIIPIPEEGMEEKNKELKLMVNAAVEEAIKPISDDLGKAQATITEQAKTIDAQKTTISAIETSEKERVKKEADAAVIASTVAEEGRKKSFMDQLKPGIAKTAEEANALWEQIKADVGAWILANPDKMTFAGNADLKYVPKGQPVVPALSANSAEERDQKFIEMGIKPASQLIKEIYPERK